MTVDRLRKQVENLSQEAAALKLEKERMSEEMRRMKMSQRQNSSQTPVKTEPIVSKPVKSSPMFAKASPPPVYINAAPAQEARNMCVKEDVGMGDRGFSVHGLFLFFAGNKKERETETPAIEKKQPMPGFLSSPFSSLLEF